MADNKKQITWTAAAATLLVANAGWAAGTSSRVAALEASEASRTDLAFVTGIRDGAN
jgi:hypothetical protein